MCVVIRFNPNHLAEASRPWIEQRDCLLPIIPRPGWTRAGRQYTKRAETLAGLVYVLGTEVCQIWPKAGNVLRGVFMTPALGRGTSTYFLSGSVVPWNQSNKEATHLVLILCFRSKKLRFGEGKWMRRMCKNQQSSLPPREEKWTLKQSSVCRYKAWSQSHKLFLPN